MPCFVEQSGHVSAHGLTSTHRHAVWTAPAAARGISWRPLLGSSTWPSWFSEPLQDEKTKVKSSCSQIACTFLCWVLKSFCTQWLVKSSPVLYVRHSSVTFMEYQMHWGETNRLLKRQNSKWFLWQVRLAGCVASFFMSAKFRKHCERSAET